MTRTLLCAAAALALVPLASIAQESRPGTMHHDHAGHPASRATPATRAQPATPAVPPTMDDPGVRATPAVPATPAIPATPAMPAHPHVIQGNPVGEGMPSAVPPNPARATAPVPPAMPADPNYHGGPYKGALTPPPPEALNKVYPVCTRKIQDSCRNPGGR
jgi:hypothetical protein